MTTTYDFGRGPVPAHRHANPDGSLGGWVADSARVNPTTWIHETATVAEWCRLGAWCWLGSRCILGEWCILGARCILGGGCILGAGCILGEWCRLGGAEFLRTPPQAIIKSWVCSLYSPTQVAIGCKVYTFDDWERPGFLERLAEANGDDAADIEHARAFIALCRRMAPLVVREVQS